MALIPANLLIVRANKFKSQLVQTVTQPHFAPLSGRTAGTGVNHSKLPSILARTSGLVGGRPRIVGLSKLTGGRKN